MRKNIFYFIKKKEKKYILHSRLTFCINLELELNKQKDYYINTINIIFFYKNKYKIIIW